MGGVARRATRIKQERGSSPYTLALDAGNSLIGDEDPARRTKGQTSVEAMNLMGYDAMALGERDLEIGLDELKKRQEEASFPFLSANVLISGTEKLLATPYVIIPMGGHRIGLIGLTGKSDNPAFHILDPLETARSYVAKLQEEADIIILLSHAGASANQRIAAEVAGIDFIINGGEYPSVNPLLDERTGTVLVHADVPSPGHAGRQLGVARLNFDSKGKLTDYQWQIVALTPEIPDDPEIASWVEAHK